MKYHRFRSRLSLFSILLLTLLAVANLYLQRHTSLARALSLAYLFLAVTQLSTYFLVYWQLTPGSLVERRLWKKRVIPYTEINRIGPPSGKLTGKRALNDWIEIRYTGIHIILATPADRTAFLADLQAHAPNAAYLI